MIRARWRQDAAGSIVLLVGGRPFGQVSTRRGKPGFEASLLLPNGLQRRSFVKREAAESYLIEGVEDYVLQQLTPAARCVLLTLHEDTSLFARVSPPQQQADRSSA